MKLRRNATIAISILAASFVARADLGRWIQDIATPSRLQAVFFRSAPMPSGAIEVRRPPQETRAELSKLLTATPGDADLYALRAREDEQGLDFTAAENDWKKHVELASDKAVAGLNLADFYHRRLRPREEIAALHSVASAPSRASDKIVPASEQQSWKVFERIQTLIADQALPVDLAIAGYRAWIARYPAENGAYRVFFEYLLAHQQFPEAEQVLHSFPPDPILTIQATASLAAARGFVDEALRVYDQNFQPLWPIELIKGYFDLLKQTHSLRRYLTQAQERIAANLRISALPRAFTTTISSKAIWLGRCERYMSINSVSPPGPRMSYSRSRSCSQARTITTKLRAATWGYIRSLAAITRSSRSWAWRMFCSPRPSTRSGSDRGTCRTIATSPQWTLGLGF